MEAWSTDMNSKVLQVGNWRWALKTQVSSCDGISRSIKGIYLYIWAEGKFYKSVKRSSRIVKKQQTSTKEGFQQEREGGDRKTK